MLGFIKSKCGLRSLLPSCEPANMWLSLNGTLKMYGPNSTLQWEIEGTTCDDKGEDCKEGLVIEEDGSVVIGGQEISSFRLYNETATLSPWPFTKDPGLRAQTDE